MTGEVRESSPQWILEVYSKPFFPRRVRNRSRTLQHLLIQSPQAPGVKSQPDGMYTLSVNGFVNIDGLNNSTTTFLSPYDNLALRAT